MHPNLEMMQRAALMKDVDRHLANANLQDPGARYDNEHGDGWDALLDFRSRLVAQGACAPDERRVMINERDKV